MNFFGVLYFNNINRKVQVTSTTKKIKYEDTEIIDLKNIDCNLYPANIYKNVLNLRFICHKSNYK